jgi:hypothetical protein
MTPVRTAQEPPCGRPPPEGIPEEFSPGLTPELMELVEAAAKM